MEFENSLYNSPVIKTEAKKANGLLIPAMALLVMLVVLFTIGIPKLNETVNLFKSISQANTDLKNLEDKNKVLVSENASQLQSDISLLNSAVPSSKDAIGLVSGMQRLAAENGLIMQTIQVAPGKLRYVQKESSGSAVIVPVSEQTAAEVTADEIVAPIGSKVVEGVETFDFQATMTGPYAQVEQFLAAFPLTLRLIDLNQINISTEGDASLGIVRVLVSGVAYYKTLPTTLPDPKLQITKLTKEQIDAIAKIKGYRVVSTLPDLKSTGSVENPF